MISIVIYGKPRAFESHEYGFDDDKTSSVDNSFPEPLLKPKNYEEMVLHYFARSGYSGIECYNRVKGFESERDGIVFGIALKTDHSFDITDVFDNILLRYWSDFASVLLNQDDAFLHASILDVLNGTKWDEEDVSLLQETIKQKPSQTPSKKICLLFAPQIEQISKVESLLKEYEDVYISANPDIFKDPINNVVFKLAKGKINTIEDGTIVEMVSESSLTSSGHSGKKTPYEWGGNRKDSSGVSGGGATGKGKDASGISGGGSVSKEKNWGVGSGKSTDEKGRGIRTVALFSVLVVLCGLFLILNPFGNKQESGSPGTDKGGGGQTPEASVGVVGGSIVNNGVSVSFNPYKKDINKSLQLNISLSKPENSSVVSSDISVEHDHPDLVEIKEEDGKYFLKVKKNPESRTSVTVTARYSGQIVGQQTYGIAPRKKDPTTPTSSHKHQYEGIRIVYSQGSEQTYFSIGQKIDVTAKDSKGIIVRMDDGVWTLPDGIKNSSSNNSKRNNPITIWAIDAGMYKITYTVAGTGQTATALFRCNR